MLFKLAGYRILMAAVIGGSLACLVSCSDKKPEAPVVTAHWPNLPNAEVPDFMDNTLFQRVIFRATDPLNVYGYSLAVNLDGTGDSTAPTGVRDYVSKMIITHGFGDLLKDKYQDLDPAQILSDKNVAIVVVEGEVPVGARVEDRFDVNVQAMPLGHTSSLSHGTLYQTGLAPMGLQDPYGIEATELAMATGGPIFVNPAYALTDAKADPSAAPTSLRTGKVLNGGVVIHNRPILMELRQPQASIARLIEQMVALRWGTPTPEDANSGAPTLRSQVICEAQDEGVLNLYVPKEYQGDWKHFLSVVSHLYLDRNPSFILAKSRELVQIAHRPNAPLADISLCLEAIGKSCLPIIAPMVSDSDPNIAFCAARAAAWLGDPGARRALLLMAMDTNQPNRLAAVTTLGGLPNSPEINGMMEVLLNSDRSDLRIAAYRVLVQNNSDSIITVNVNDHFYLDVVDSDGPPLVYATNEGNPRLAVFGHVLTLRTPITFLALDNRLSISSDDKTPYLTLFYRDPRLPEAQHELARNDFAVMLALLGGTGPSDAQLYSLGGGVFSFQYNEVVAIAAKLVQNHQVFGTDRQGQPVACAFELQHPAEDTWTSIPLAQPEGRPQGDGGVTPINGPKPLSSSTANPSTAPAASAGRF